MTDYNIKNKLLNYFGKNIKPVFQVLDSSYFKEVEEIRIRLNKNIIIKSKNNKEYIVKYGNVAYTPTSLDINQTIEIMSDYSS
ncbi:MAG: hypothetical protein R3Y29_09045 [bacterium]